MVLILGRNIWLTSRNTYGEKELMKPNKKLYVDFIIDELSKGNVQFNAVFAVFKGKFRLTENTFIKYWKIANEAHRATQDAVNEARVTQSIVSEIETVKKATLTKIDRILIAELIAQGIGVAGTIQTPTPTEQLKALDYLSKIEGDYAATKTEVEVSDKRIDASKLDKQTLKKIAEARTDLSREFLNAR